MYGPSINELNVYRRENGADVREWTRAGDQGPIWKYGQVYLTGSYNVSRVILDKGPISGSSA